MFFITNLTDVLRIRCEPKRFGKSGGHQKLKPDGARTLNNNVHPTPGARCGTVNHDNREEGSVDIVVCPSVYSVLHAIHGDVTSVIAPISSEISGLSSSICRARGGFPPGLHRDHVGSKGLLQCRLLRSCRRRRRSTWVSRVALNNPELNHIINCQV